MLFSWPSLSPPPPHAHTHTHTCTQNNSEKQSWTGIRWNKLKSLVKLQSFKWQEHLSWQRKVNEAKASAEALKASLGELDQERKPQESKWRTFFRRSRLEVLEVVKNNIYDKGIFHNVFEVVIPFSTRRSFLGNKSKSG